MYCYASNLPMCSPFVAEFVISAELNLSKLPFKQLTLGASTIHKLTNLIQRNSPVTDDFKHSPFSSLNSCPLVFIHLLVCMPW